MDLGEWLRGYRNVADHGFVALRGIVTLDDAYEVFTMIDDNGGGMILLDEWCAFLKNCEVAAQTPVGRLLSEKKGGGEPLPV